MHHEIFEPGAWVFVHAFISEPWPKVGQVRSHTISFDGEKYSEKYNIELVYNLSGKKCITVVIVDPDQLERRDPPKRLNMGKPCEAPKDIKGYPRPKVGQRFAHKKTGLIYEILWVGVEQYGKLRDLAPDGDIYVYRQLGTAEDRFGARLCHSWEKEMGEFHLLDHPSINDVPR